MARNTFFLIAGLAILAAAVMAFNLSRPQKQTTTSGGSTALITTPTPAVQSYANNPCGISFLYPSSLALLNTPTNSAIFTDTGSGESIVVLCQKDIPIPALPADKIDVSRLTASVSAQLYHDASAKDGAPINKFMFIHPRTKLTIYIAGYGPAFNQIIKTIQLY